jgi:hypothetical protein
LIGVLLARQTQNHLGDDVQLYLPGSAADQLGGQLLAVDGGLIMVGG